MRGINIKLACLLKAVFVHLTAVLVCDAYDAKAWQSLGGNTQTLPYPEKTVPEVMARPNIGITLSGGGSRAFLASIGYLGAFHQLNIMEKVRYIVGVSGGGWANIVYSFYQYSNVSDYTMLGPIVMPEDINMESLAEIDENCVRQFTNSSYFLEGIYFQDWVNACEAIYFEPSGIAAGVPYSYNETTIADIKARNPQLADQLFYMPRGAVGNTTEQGIDKRPYPIISSTLVGPLDYLPARPDNRNYNLIEYTPLSVGVGYSNNLTYSSYYNDTNSTTYIVGGIIEPFAYDLGTAASAGLPPGAHSGSLDIPDSPIMCDLALTGASGSWAPGTTIAASLEPALWETAGMENYSAPSASHPDDMLQVFAVADGAGVSNTNFISLLQRQVSTIFAFINTDKGLQNSTHWNPAVDPLLTEDIDFTVPAWWGQIAVDLTPDNIAAYDLANSHVFEDSEWLEWVTAMQAAQAVGKGNVISMDHTTVHNEKYGIEAGFKVHVVWYMLGRNTAWEAKLSEDMYPRLVPENDAANQYNTIDAGDFRHFPGYSTALADQNIRQSNVLSDFTGWGVLQNQELYFTAIDRAISEASSTGAPSLKPTARPTSSATESLAPTVASTHAPSLAPTATELTSLSPVAASISEAPTTVSSTSMHPTHRTEAPTSIVVVNVSSHGSEDDDDFAESTIGIITIISCSVLIVVVFLIIGASKKCKERKNTMKSDASNRNSEMIARSTTGSMRDNLI